MHSNFERSLETLTYTLIVILAFSVYARVDSFMQSPAQQTAALAYTASILDAFLGIGVERAGTTNTNTTDETQAETTTVVDTATHSFIDGVSYSSPVSGSSASQLWCLPATITPNEPALIAWYCDAESFTASFAIDDAPYGIKRIYPEDTTKYSFTCGEETPHTCSIRVITPAIALRSSESVVSGASANIYWDSVGTTGCALASDTNESFNRFGVAGDVQSHVLYQDTTFTLSCETTSGSILEKTTEVNIQ